jgi:hypothetical protein
VGFNGAKDDGVHGVIHETIEQDKGKELTREGFKFPLHVVIEDSEVNPLHMIFNLNGVLVGKEYLELITSCLHHLTWLGVLLYY